MSSKVERVRAGIIVTTMKTSEDVSLPLKLPSIVKTHCRPSR